MGLFSSVTSLFTGSDQAKAAKGAAAVQSQAISRAKGEIQEGKEAALAPIQPFTEAGTTGISDLASLVTDPTRQAEFIEENPFFDALAEQSQRELLQQQATTGRLGAGETAEELQRRLVTLGSDLLGRDIQQRLSLANLGLTGALQESGIESQTAANLANLTTQRGAVEAGGIIGAQQARTAGAANLVNLGSKIAGFSL